MRFSLDSGLEGNPAAAPCTHGDDDDAGLCDDLLGQLVEDGVGVVVKRLQLLLQVVQADVGPEPRALIGAVHRRRRKLDHRVVLTVGPLKELKREEGSK